MSRFVVSRPGTASKGWPLASVLLVLGSGCGAKRVPFDEMADTTSLATSWTTASNSEKPESYSLSIYGTKRCVAPDEGVRVELNGKPMQRVATARKNIVNKGGMSPGIACEPTQFEIPAAGVSEPLVFTVKGKSKSVLIEPLPPERIKLRIVEPAGGKVRGGQPLVLESSVAPFGCEVTLLRKNKAGEDNTIASVPPETIKITGTGLRLEMPRNDHDQRAIVPGPLTVWVSCGYEKAIKRCTAAECSTQSGTIELREKMELVP